MPPDDVSRALACRAGARVRFYPAAGDADPGRAKTSARWRASSGRGSRRRGMPSRSPPMARPRWTSCRAPAYDLVILDVMLPKRDGFEVLKALRQQRIQTPVLMLTARDAVADKVAGARPRRRRLSHQAVCLRRVPRARARAAAPGRRARARRRSSWTISPRPRHARGHARPRGASPSPRASTRCSSTSCAMSAAC